MTPPTDPPQHPAGTTLQPMPDGSVATADRTRLPFEFVPLTLRTLDDRPRAVTVMKVRGASPIGAPRAVPALRDDPSDPALQRGERVAAACAIAVGDARINRSLGAHGADLLRSPAPSSQPLQVFTHCNAGRLATVEHGTALAPIYTLHAGGVPVHVSVDGTRPCSRGVGLRRPLASRA